MKKVLMLVVAVTLLAGCGANKHDEMRTQRLTAQELGLASTDEVTLSNVKEGEADALGGKRITFNARTNKGRNFACSYLSTPALLPFDAT